MERAIKEKVVVEAIRAIPELRSLSPGEDKENRDSINMRTNIFVNDQKKKSTYQMNSL